MLHRFGVPCRTLPQDQGSCGRRSLFASLALSGVSRTLRRTAVVVSIPAALLMSVFAPATQPVAVQATPVASSVELAATNAAGTLRLGAPLQQAQVGTTTTAVNFRTGPSTGYSIIAVLPAGTQGTVLGTSNGWYNIQTSRGTGWVLGTYFRIGGAAAPAPATGTGYVTISSLNMRSGPGTGYSVIAVLPYGTQGNVLAQSNGWYQISTSRGTGWVLGTYFRIGSSIAPAPAPVSGVVGARAAMVPNGQFISGWGAARASGAHQGEDLAAPYGSPIYAPATLTIVSNTWNSLGGWTVIGRDTKGRHWYFAHMSSQSRAWGTVAKGQIIGYVGMTGDAQGTTPHLHYQVTSYGWVWANPVVVLQSYPDVP